MSIDLIHGDCMDYMRELPDRAFDLAIVDPPYGISATSFGMGEGYRGGVKNARGSLRGTGKLKDRALNRMASNWDAEPPGADYFAELMRVSNQQIIWGGNYFELPTTRCVICWDKQQPWENFSQWEMAWTSFDKPAPLFRYQNSSNEPGKIHPTQKPVKLYRWTLEKFATPEMSILDTHLGSGSSAIAAHQFGSSRFVGIEKNAAYIAAARNRFTQETAQQQLFS